MFVVVQIILTVLAGYIACLLHNRLTGKQPQENAAAIMLFYVANTYWILSGAMYLLGQFTKY